MKKWYKEMIKITAPSAISMIAMAIISTNVAAVSMSDYMVITTGDPNDGHAFKMSNSEIGAILENSKTSLPGSMPVLPGGTERTVSYGITLDGDAALTNGGSILTFGDSDVHAINTGDTSVGSQGVDCASSFNTCTDSGSQISSGNRFNQSAPNAAFSTLGLGNMNGVQGGINLSDVTTEILSSYYGISSAAATGDIIDLSTGGLGGKIENKLNEVWDFSGDSFVGLNIIDIKTDADFNIVNSNLTIKGDAGDTIIFRLEEFATMNVSESNLLLDGGIGDNNVLWFADANDGEESFNFNNVTFQGMSLWDIDDNEKNAIVFDNVQFCGQVVSDKVEFSNVSGSGCAYGAASVVPVPAAAWLFGSGLIGLVGVARRKKA